MSPRARHLALLALAALAVRLPLLRLSAGAPYDMDSYARVAACPGPGLYVSPALAGRYPYLPLWWLVLKALAALRGFFGGDPGLWFRLPGLVGDLAICFLAYGFASRRRQGMRAAGPSDGAGLAAGLGWALNPLAVLVSAGHGQFDSLALALVLGAAWLLDDSKRPDGDLWAALCLAAAVALKTWPLAFLPLFLGAFEGKRERGRFAAWALLPPLLLLLPWVYGDGFAAVASRLSYAGADALGLPGALKACFFSAGAPPQLWARTDFWFRAAALAGLGLFFGFVLLRPRGLRLLESLPWVALGLVLLAPGLSPQYLVWAPALALAAAPDLAWRLSLAALPLAVGFYALFMPGVLAGPFAWPTPAPSSALILAWGAANLLWWSWTAVEWKRLGRADPGLPKRRNFFLTGS